MCHEDCCKGLCDEDCRVCFVSRTVVKACVTRTVVSVVSRGPLCPSSQICCISLCHTECCVGLCHEDMLHPLVSYEVSREDCCISLRREICCMGWCHLLIGLKEKQRCSYSVVLDTAAGVVRIAYHCVTTPTVTSQLTTLSDR